MAGGSGINRSQRKNLISRFRGLRFAPPLNSSLAISDQKGKQRMT
jgi:hypothetical protein